jgi:hypothetical protein
MQPQLRTVSPQRDTSQWPESVQKRVSLLSNRDHKGRYDPLPRSLTSLESNYSRFLLSSLLNSHIPVLPAECAEIVGDVLPLYWETQFNEETLLRQQAFWYETLKYHTRDTIQSVAVDWVANAKRKPTPADFLELANGIDSTPERILRVQQIVAIPVLEVIQAPVAAEKPLIGCPIVLGRILKLAETKGMHFGEHQQLNYLHTGVLPDWATEEELRPVTVTTTSGMPSRDELLANMTPEERVAALKK